MNDRREKVRSENPNMTFTEITKFLASEWSKLPQEKKQVYLNAAEEDKERYNREFSDYKQTEAYRQFKAGIEKLERHDNKKEKNGTEINAEPNVCDIVLTYILKLRLI